MQTWRTIVACLFSRQLSRLLWVTLVFSQSCPGSALHSQYATLAPQHAHSAPSYDHTPHHPSSETEMAASKRAGSAVLSVAAEGEPMLVAPWPKDLVGRRKLFRIPGSSLFEELGRGIQTAADTLRSEGYDALTTAEMDDARPARIQSANVDGTSEGHEQSLTKTHAPKSSQMPPPPDFTVPIVVGVVVMCAVCFFGCAMNTTRPHDSVGHDDDDDHSLLRKKAHSKTPEELAALTGSALLGAKLVGVAPADKAKLGLDEERLEELRKTFGENKISPPEQENMWVALVKQTFGTLFNGLLWVCVGAQLILSVAVEEEIVTPIILGAVIVGSSVLQWWTEQQAQSMMNSLMNLQAAEDILVIRKPSGEVRIPPWQLLPGDIVILEAGQRVPADVRVLDCTDGALVENSALTGESIAEPRSADVESESTGLMEAKNILFSGTSVTQGRLMCVVFGIGDKTVLGVIASTIRTARPRSSLELQIEHFVHIIAFVAISVGIISLAIGFYGPVKRHPTDIFRNTATAVFAQVPEGLLPTVTICLMIAGKKLAEKQVIVRKIDAIETLGCVSVLCSDKTGTLTSGHMTATDFVVYVRSGQGTLRKVSARDVEPTSAADATSLLQCGVLNCSAVCEEPGEWRGSPTEVAIVSACQRALGDQAKTIQIEHKQVFEIPFSSANKWMLTIHSAQRDGKHAFRIILKGASERVLDRCSLSTDIRKQVDSQLEELMGQGKRVLCLSERWLMDKSIDFAFKGSGPGDVNFPMDEFDFCGLVAIEDPPKIGVPESIEKVLRAGATPVMVTGDHPSTARAIAQRIGILASATKGGSKEESGNGEEDYSVVTGATLEDYMPSNGSFDSALSSDGGDSERLIKFWKQCVMQTRVFARVSPMHKRTIVRAYQLLGDHIVAMTGDGVNDAPALKEAEVGIAMGIRGTEVAKEAADIVLLDDDLRSIVEGMEQGRLCSENLRKSVMYTLCSKIPQLLPNFAEVFCVPGALKAMHVLLIDIGTDIWTAIAYAWQPIESDLMNQAPRHPKKDKMVNNFVLGYSYIYMGFIQSALCWAFFFSMPDMISLTSEKKLPGDYTADEKHARISASTMYYWTLVCGQIGAGLATTTTRESLFSYGLPNLRLNCCIIFEIIFGALSIYWPPAQNLFELFPLEGWRFGAATFAVFLIVTIEEIRKLLIRRRS